MSAFARYDVWLTNAPETGVYPLRCSECRERVFRGTEDLAGQPHCFDEDTGEPVGQLDWDYDADPSIP